LEVLIQRPRSWDSFGYQQCEHSNHHQQQPKRFDECRRLSSTITVTILTILAIVILVILIVGIATLIVNVSRRHRRRRSRRARRAVRHGHHTRGTAPPARAAADRRAGRCTGR
jgi:hypothetical protein